MALVSMDLLKPDQFINMMSPCFIRSNKLQMCLNHLRLILHVPLHYFHSTPLYAPFLTNLSANEKNMNLSLRGTAEQYSQTCDFYGPKIRMNHTLSSSQSISPQQHQKKRPNHVVSPTKNKLNNANILSSKSGTISKSISISQKVNDAMKSSVSYIRNPHYKKNMICSSKEHFHLKVVNDEYVSRSTGAENNPENEHNQSRNKHEMELNEKEHIMTLVCALFYFLFFIFFFSVIIYK